MESYKEIHIGEMIQVRVEECNIDTFRICSFFKCSEEEVSKMYHSKALDTDSLLRWCKLLEYDFFRIYSQHLVFFSPPANSDYNRKQSVSKSKLPTFRKNLYTREMIDFILNMMQTGQKTKNEIIEDYNIPKTTLYKWISKSKTTSK